MGLTSWKNSPDGLIYKYDVVVAKNYLNEEELKNPVLISQKIVDNYNLKASFFQAFFEKSSNQLPFVHKKQYFVHIRRKILLSLLLFDYFGCSDIFFSVNFRCYFIIKDRIMHILSFLYHKIIN